MADVTAVFSSRAAFSSAYPAPVLFDHATDIKAAGLSLNAICQSYPHHQFKRLLESGTHIKCLFLDPKGQAIQAREIDEEHVPGTLTIAGDGAGVVVLDGRQPRPGGLAGGVDHPDVQLGVVGLPDLVRFGRFPPVHQLIHLSVPFGPFVRHNLQCRVDAGHDVVHGPIPRPGPATLGGHADGLPMDLRDRRTGRLERQPLDEGDQLLR
ncbi:DUF5919 domain-containing protein [Nonomuraea sp. NPDC049695]|uniref:DUF5919 domain-containing protein n=1 Tax=Nonomuraea sp. NPDC049695 TaxID=3154734 RepID=UPI00342573C0